MLEVNRGLREQIFFFPLFLMAMRVSVINQASLCELSLEGTSVLATECWDYGLNWQCDISGHTIGLPCVN